VPSILIASPVKTGDQLLVNTDDLVTAMNHIIHQYDKIRAIALTDGVAYVKNNYTWRHAAETFVKVLREFVL
jgi:hypothetical protein